MKPQRGWNIHTRTQLISLGPALVLTLLLTGFLTSTRVHELRQEVQHIGQLTVNQLVPSVEYGISSGKLQVLQLLLQASLKNPHLCFIEIHDRNDKLLMHLANPEQPANCSEDIERFQSPIEKTQISREWSGTRENPEQANLGQVSIGISADALKVRQHEIFLKASIPLLIALLLIVILARYLASFLARPLSMMSKAVTEIQKGNYQTSLPELGNRELANLAKHINSLAMALNNASREQQQAMTLLIKAREEAELANRAKSDFLAMMSHELRTPMNGVLGMLQLLETTQMNEEQSEYASLASESTGHLLKVIDDILDFSRIERGALELEHIDFSPLELLNTTVQAFQHSALHRGLALCLEIDEHLPALQAQGDPTRIRQILVNLIGNALKFTEHGEVRIKAHWEAIDEQTLWFRCHVMDTGIGITVERLEAMFDPFQQADNSISRRYGGTGLGLPIARTLAEHMGGTLHAQSEVGKGSCFTLEIPLPYSNTCLPTEDTPATPKPRPKEKPHVLLVEDNSINQTVIEAMLRSLGYRVSLASDGAHAVSSVEQGQFDAVLMDCRLPTLDGYEATRRIRQLGGVGQLPIIALTANALQGDREACLQAGMNDYLAKPFKRTQLQQTLERWLAPGNTSRHGQVLDSDTLV